MSERICERCHKIMRVEGDVCPDDGGRLLTVQSPEALVGRDIDGKLTLTGILGQGGMGVVYRARQHSMDREVAVKVLNPSFAGDAEAVRRFLHEARAATRLDHPNIITVFDFGQTSDGVLYIVMELLVGTSLAAEVDAGALAPARAIHIMTQVADAVHHAHGRGLVHRDLKPENVYLLRSSSLRGDFVKVLDFGIATMRSQEGLERITRTGAVCGTPAYMAPEQVLGDPIDARADVYALGIIMYEMLTGVHPLRADTPMRQMMAHLEQPVPSFASLGRADLPPALEATVRRALEKKREQRTPTALAFANDLVAAEGKATESFRASSDSIAVQSSRLAFAETGRATPMPPRPRPAWRTYGPYGALVLLIAGALTFFLTREPRTDAGAPVAVATPEAVAAKPDPVPTKAPAPAPTPEPVAAKPDPVPTMAPPAAPEPVAAKPDPIPIEAPPAAIAPATTMIVSTPTGAQVLVDGKEVGSTPLAVERPSGDARKKVTLKLRGRSPETVELLATSGDTLDVKLRPAPSPGTTGNGATTGTNGAATTPPTGTTAGDRDALE